MKHHHTPLKQHFSDPYFWCDTILVIILWCVWFWWPEKATTPLLDEVKTALKIIALIAGLEWITFLSFHLMKREHGVVVQGLLGGMVSSTAIFIKLTRSSAAEERHHVSVALLSATVAMLVECLLIVINFSENRYIELLLPILIQIPVLMVVIFVLSLKGAESASPAIDNYRVVDDPVVWKKVVKLSFLIMALIWGMRLLKQYTAFSPELTTYLMSLFEAHGVLTAAMIADHTYPALLLSVLLILSGHTTSKSYLILTAKSEHVSPLLAWVLLACLGLSWGVYALIR